MITLKYVSDNEDYFKKFLLNKIIKNKGKTCYISFNKSCSSIRENFNEKMNNNFYVIDGVTKLLKEPVDDEKCKFILPYEIENLKEEVKQFIKKGCSLIIFDSLSNLIIYGQMIPAGAGIIPKFINEITQDQNKIAEIKKSRISLRNARIKLLKGRELFKELDNEKVQIENLIKKLQTDFYIQKKISESEYKTQFQILNERLAEIEEERSTIHIMESRHSVEHSNSYAKPKSGMINKIFKGIKNILVYPYKYFKGLRYKVNLRDDAKVKAKIKEMLEKK